MIIYIILLLIYLFFLFTFINKKFYCFVHNHKDWKLWEYYISHSYMFTYDGTIYGDHVFYVGDDKNTRAYVYCDGKNICSIHNDAGLVLCDFDEYHAKKMRELLLSKIDEIEEYKK